MSEVVRAALSAVVEGQSLTLDQARDAMGAVMDGEATPAQLALAWLLQRSPVLLPIPGTSTVVHLEENVGAALIELSPEQVGQLEGVDGG